MAAIASTDVSYVVGKSRKDDSSNKSISVAISFGDGVLTYPAGGIPLDKNKLGCPNSIVSVNLTSPASNNGFLYKYDLVNNKIRIYQGDNANVAAAPLIELSGSAAPASATLNVVVTGF